MLSSIDLCSPSLVNAISDISLSPNGCSQDQNKLLDALLVELSLADECTHLFTRLSMFQLLIWEKLNTGHWAKVWHGWRDLYGLIMVAKVRCVVVMVLEKKSETFKITMERIEMNLVRDVIKMCDMGIMMGGSVMHGILEKIAQDLTKACIRPCDEKISCKRNAIVENQAAPKRCRREKDCFILEEKSLKLPLSLHPVERISCPSIPTFITKCKLPLKATVVTNCMADWPCMLPETRWSCERLVQIAGPRMVPVEIGRAYTDQSWTQNLLSVESFVDKYMDDRNNGIGYLAQHRLLDQVPELGADIVVPDYCYTGSEEVEPEVNVWIGPGGTVSPAHTDKKHNLLCQIVGSKYVALFYPDQNERMYPHKSPLLANTSMINMDIPDLNQFPLIDKLQGFHTILKEGEMLYIPPMVWHYVKSLEQSFSVSFWWE